MKKAQTFADNLAAIAEWMPDSHRPPGEIRAGFVSGSMPTGERNAALERLRNTRDDEHGVLSNARCLAEGVDVPSLDGIAFIDPRSSQVDIVQAVGRAIRLAPDKESGKILIPVYVSGGDDVAEILASSALTASGT